jgi:pyruvate/2-oxoglutarate dehydrogenase complex dihydrolipoamide acyltransferase (E2) component
MPDSGAGTSSTTLSVSKSTRFSSCLLQAQQNAAMLTTFNEVNMQNVIDLRKQYQDRFTAKHNVKSTIFFSMPAKSSWSASRKTGTIKPRGEATAMPTS